MAAETQTDEDAFRAWIQGSADAGTQLVERHYERMLLFFRAKVAPEVAKDLVQSTFETLCTKKLDFRGDSSVLTYLFGIARWKLVHHFRGEQTYRDRFDPLEDSANNPEVEISVTSLFAGRQEQTLVVRALRSLPLDDQIILELKEYEGMSSRQLAEVYGINRETMSSRVTRARARLVTATRALASDAKLIDTTVTGLEQYMREIRQTMASTVLKSET